MNYWCWKAGRQLIGNTIVNASLLETSIVRDFLVAQTVKLLPTMWETRVRSPDGEDPLEKEMATHCSTLAWKSPWTKEAGGLQPMESHRVRRN